MTAMAATPLQKELIAATYEDVEKLVCWMVHKFIRRKGGRFEEWKPVADLAFVRFYYTWRPERGSFTNWIAFNVYTELLEEQRNIARKKELAKIESVDFEELEKRTPERTSGFKLFEFLDELGEDAKIVARLAVETPAELVQVMVELGGKPHHRRKALRDYLRDLGWTGARISESFAEIKTILTHY